MGCSVMELYKDSGIITDIKSRIMEWLEHVSRIKTKRTPEVKLDSKFDRKKIIIGRQKTKWFTDIENYLMRTGVGNCSPRAEEKIVKLFCLNNIIRSHIKFNDYTRVSQ